LKTEPTLLPKSGASVVKSSFVLRNRHFRVDAKLYVPFKNQLSV